MLSARSIENRAWQARLLLTYPPRVAKHWTEADIDPAAEEEIAARSSACTIFEPTTDDSGDERPVLVRLTNEAKAAWRAYYDAHAREQAELSGDLSAAWSKLEEYPARLALVVHCARWAADDPTLTSADAVDEQSMAAGIRLTEWHKHEARRVYSMLGEDEDDRDRRRLIEWIGQRDGSVTARDVQTGCRWLRNAGAAEAALNALATAGAGKWEPTPHGQRGQPTRRFRLAARCPVSSNSAPARDNANTADADIAELPESLADEGEWGEI